MRSALLLVPALALACRGSAEKSPEDSAGAGTTPNNAGEAADLPSAYDPDLPDQAVAEYVAADVEEALQLAVDGLASLDTDPVLNAYHDAMDSGEGYCPAYYEQDGNTFWYASCSTSDGTTYDGYGFYNYYEDYITDDDGNVWDTEYISGAATVHEPSGSVFHVGGYVQRSWTENAGGWQAHSDNYAGSFRVDDSPAGSWLDQGLQPAIGIYRAWKAGSGGGAYFVAQGALGGLGNDGLVAAETDNLLAATQSVGVPCELEPAGTLTVRTANGGWWDITFDMNPETYALEGECDGCGTVTDAAGAVQGQACADFSPLLSTEL